MDMYEKIMTTENSHVNAPRVYSYLSTKLWSGVYADRSDIEEEAVIARNIINRGYPWDEEDEEEYALYRAQGYSPKAAFNKVWRG